MPTDLPARLRRPRVEASVMSRFRDLCDEIEDRVGTGDDGELPALLAEWNAKAHRPYEPREFTSYAGAMDQDDFVLGALAPPPRFIDDLRFDEARDAINGIMNANLSEADTHYAIDVIEMNLRGCNLSDLIFWPNEWFGDESMLEVAMTPEQVLGYAMKKSQRTLEGTPPDLELPWPLPK